MTQRGQNPLSSNLWGRPPLHTALCKYSAPRGFNDLAGAGPRGLAPYKGRPGDVRPSPFSLSSWVAKVQSHWVQVCPSPLYFDYIFCVHLFTHSQNKLIATFDKSSLFTRSTPKRLTYFLQSAGYKELLRSFYTVVHTSEQKVSDPFMRR